MKSFVYTVRIDGKYHYIFLYSLLKYGTDAFADISHDNRVNQKILISPCMYIGGNYTIEVHSNEYPNGGYYYPLNGTGNFTECTELMKTVFTETKDIHQQLLTMKLITAFHLQISLNCFMAVHV